MDNFWEFLSNLKKDKTYEKAIIIPEAEVIEVKTNQLLMTSKMDMLDGELENSGDILAPKGNFDDDDLSLFGE